jgi:hypothetical protein
LAFFLLGDGLRPPMVGSQDEPWIRLGEEAS